MKIFKFFFILVLLCTTNVFSQKIIKHKIKSGESILGLALKYKVSEKSIYELNPKTKGAILSLNQEIKIPNKNFKEKEKKAKKGNKEVVVDKKDKKDLKNDLKDKKTLPSDQNKSTTIHIVLPKETLYSLSKQYGITMELLCEMNPELKTSNLKKGAKIKVPILPSATDNVKNQKSTSAEKFENITSADVVPQVDVVHKVLPKETLYRISKQYGVTVADLEKLNPGIENGLPIDYLLIVKKGIRSAPEAINDSISDYRKEEVIDVKNIPVGNLEKANFLIQKASEHLGTHYRAGGTTSAGFDCSGLMYNTFRNIDMTLPRSSYEMATYGVRIDKAHAQKGDLIFFATFGHRRISHVGMITEVAKDGEIKFIHSSTSTGVVISSTKEPYYTKTFVQINRVITE
jgi:cell wall-associated NlpC family hydrolase